MEIDLFWFLPEAERGRRGGAGGVGRWGKEG